MGKRFSRAVPIAQTLMGSLLAGASFSAMSQSEPFSANALDWEAWDKEAAATQLCRGRYVMPGYRLAEQDNPETVAAEAIEADYASDGKTILRGDVVLRRANEEVEADKITMPADRERINAQGNIALRDGTALVRGDTAEIMLNEDRTLLDNSRFVLYDQHLRGQAVQLEQLEKDQYRLQDASFTTCDPGDNTWQLVSSDIRLNQAAGFGTARHARLEIKDVPVMYVPWVRFPIDDRRHTGLLTPAIRISGDGLDYTQPFYWNIAPNRDATITPRWMTDHGLLLNGEFRYLEESVAGTIEAGYLNSDDGGSGGAEGRFAGQSRWYFETHNAGRINPRSRYRLDYGAASDGRYFDDFGGEFGSSDRVSMERLAQVDYRGERWRLDARAQGFQRLDDPLNERDKPFYRLPSLSADARWQLGNGVYTQWRSNATYFWRDVNEQRLSERGVAERELATGSRLHLTPALGWRVDRPWGYVEPRTELWHTDYQLDYGDRATDNGESPSRTVAITSVDSGLVFERELALGGRDYRQTLEPRLNYAYVPRTDQSELPDFDSSERPFSWNQLWSAQRFSGADRVGDLNRLSLGVESRLLEDETGRNRLSVGVGQSIYFDERRIDIEGDADTLPPRSDDERYYQATRDRSPLVSRVDWQINDRWSTGYAWLYDDHRERTESSTAEVRYRHPEGHVVNLGYRWEIEDFDPSVEPTDDSFRNYAREEWDFSFAWKASPQIDLIGRYLHDQTNARSLEQLAGVQWNDCCYGLQVVWREWVDDNDTARINDDFNDRGIFLRFVFRGLGGVGQNADGFFEQAIPGYRPTPL